MWLLISLRLQFGGRNGEEFELQQKVKTLNNDFFKCYYIYHYIKEVTLQKWVYEINHMPVEIYTVKKKICPLSNMSKAKSKLVGLSPFAYRSV